MNGQILRLGLIVGIATLTGCAASPDREVRTATVTRDELPNYAASRRGLTSRIEVDDRTDQPRQILVSKYEVPEPTEEEKEALGIEEPAYDPLVFYDPRDPIARGVYNERALPQVMILGRGGALSYADPTGYRTTAMPGLDPFSFGGAAVGEGAPRYIATVDPIVWQRNTGVQDPNPVVVDIHGETAHSAVDPTDDLTR